MIISSAKSEWFPDVPAIPDLAELTPEQEKKLSIAIALQSAKPFYTAPGVPQDRVDFLRDVFNQIMETKGFLRQAKLRWTVWEAPHTGEEYAKTVQAAMAIPSEDVASLLEAIKEWAAKNKPKKD